MNDDDPTAAEIDKLAVRRAFEKAAKTYHDTASLQRHIAHELIEQLDYMAIAPRRILDVGAGTGFCTIALAERFPSAEIVAVDLAEAMLHETRARLCPSGIAKWMPGKHRQSTRRFVCADAEQLPLADASVDLIVSSLAFQWCNNLSAALRECRRVLTPQGLLLFSSLGPDSLRELRQAFSKVTNSAHVSRFLDLHDVGSLMVDAGLSGPVLSRDEIVEHYDSFRAALQSVRGIGASNALQSRNKALTGKALMRAAAEAYEHEAANGGYPLTYEIVYAHAWCPTQSTRPQDGSTVAQFSFEALKNTLPRDS